jgi:hypothetical protein
MLHMAFLLNLNNGGSIGIMRVKGRMGDFNFIMQSAFNSVYNINSNAVHALLP